MPEALPKEAVEFLTRFGGASASMLEQFALDVYYSKVPEARGNFPFTRPESHLPRYSELIIAGLAIPPWLVGILLGDDARKKGDTKTAEMARTIEMFGEGGIFYAAPMLTHTTIVHNTPARAPGARPAGQGSPPPGAREAPPPAAIVYKL